MILQIHICINMGRLWRRFQRDICGMVSKLLWIWIHRIHPRNLLQTDFWIRSWLWSTSIITILVIKNGWKYINAHLSSKQGRELKIGLQQKFCIIMSLWNIFIIWHSSKHCTLKTCPNAPIFGEIEQNALVYSRMDKIATGEWRQDLKSSENVDMI